MESFQDFFDVIITTSAKIDHGVSYGRSMIYHTPEVRWVIKQYNFTSKRNRFPFPTIRPLTLQCMCYPVYHKDTKRIS